jgi:hypothetical protein
MVETLVKPDWWTVEIEGMPQFDMAMKRVYAWFENEIIDRPPIRFQAHNAFLASATEEISRLSKEDKKAWWFDVETQVDLFIKPIEGRRFMEKHSRSISPTWDRMCMPLSMEPNWCLGRSLRGLFP